MHYIQDHALIIPAAVYIVIINLVTFIFYGYDKSRARKSLSRIPEKKLHTFALIGGSVGALIGQRVFHHKTRKFKFQIIFWLIFLLHCVLVIGLCRVLF